MYGICCRQSNEERSVCHLCQTIQAINQKCNKNDTTRLRIFSSVYRMRVELTAHRCTSRDPYNLFLFFSNVL